MAANYNHTVLAGNLTRAVEIRFLANDRQVAQGTIACNRKYRDGAGELKEEACFIDFEAWGKVAEVFGKYTSKGSPVLIDGRLRLDRWEDKDGNKRSKLKLVVGSLQLMGGQRGGAEPGPGPNAAGDPAPSGGRGGDDDSGPIPEGSDDEPPF